MNTQRRHTCPAATNPFDTLGSIGERGELPRVARVTYRRFLMRDPEGRRTIKSATETDIDVI